MNHQWYIKYFAKFQRVISNTRLLLFKLTGSDIKPLTLPTAFPKQLGAALHTVTDSSVQCSTISWRSGRRDPHQSMFWMRHCGWQSRDFFFPGQLKTHHPILPVEIIENKGIVSRLSWKISSAWKAVMRPEDKSDVKEQEMGRNERKVWPGPNVRGFFVSRRHVQMRKDYEFFF